MENRKSRASVIFLSLAGTSVDGEYEPEKYRVPQFNNVDLDVFGLFTSRTEKRRPVFIISLLNTNINMCHRPYAKMAALCLLF